MKELIYAPKNFGQTISIVSYGENEIFLFKSLSLWIKGIRAGIITIADFRCLITIISILS